MIEFLVNRFEAARQQDAFAWRDQTYTYEWLLNALAGHRQLLQAENISPGAIVSLEADFSPNAVSLLVALIERGCIVAPLTSNVGLKKAEFRQIGEISVIIEVGDDDSIRFQTTGTPCTHELLLGLQRVGGGGLILFSSGSTGKSKAAVHAWSRLLAKYHVSRKNYKTLAFLLFDHIGGIDTLLYSLSNASCLVTLESRLPEAVCRMIEKYRVEVLPVSPTFLNLLILSGAAATSDLSSIRFVTYGAEVMPEVTLKKCLEIFPQATFLQKYGTTEIGTMRSKSKASDSLWVKVGGEGYETRVVNGMLEIKAVSAMVGYLNAPSPFTADGWFQTGDAVEVDGEYFRILGRTSELINVGGEKVYPAEVESVLLEMENVVDAYVYGEPNPITGQIVVAGLLLENPEERATLRQRVHKHCEHRLASHKIPIKVKILEKSQHSDRFKKLRRELFSKQ